ncbi:uncharacterized protein RCO7_14858 [Rhynchosporium graminicola]|uniref:Uncharacterized protein n=1 Tax=Rhynchosporium graminicola TaxID=2792576 RepID=A0A1E1L684_9HELO|nr:uncharacterized protein RCO7_14858 [Rhynchosporium commune]
MAAEDNFVAKTSLEANSKAAVAHTIHGFRSAVCSQKVRSRRNEIRGARSRLLAANCADSARCEGFGSTVKLIYFDFLSTSLYRPVSCFGISLLSQRHLFNRSIRSSSPGKTFINVSSTLALVLLSASYLPTSGFLYFSSSKYYFSSIALALPDDVALYNFSGISANPPPT